jgi:ribosomal protein S18 acetylase RimI-like enzyme
MDVRRAEVERVPQICDTLARAFADEPLSTWPIGDVSDLRDAVRLTFELVDQHLAQLGLLWEIGDAYGAAAWIPPSHLEDYLRVEAATRPAIAELTADGGERWGAVWDWIEAHIPDEPLWFLDHVGVAPSHQARGLGRLLVEHGLRLADADGLAVFLETATPSNVPYYHRFGFEVVAEGDAPLNGPHAWFMRRDPVARAPRR